MLMLIVFILSLVTAPLCAQNHFENTTLRVFAGYNKVSVLYGPNKKVKSRDGEVFGFAVGYKFSSAYRFEGEIAYRTNEITGIVVKGTKPFVVPLKGDLVSVSFMGNMFIEPHMDTYLHPYLGFGFGMICEYGDWHMSIIENSICHDFEGYERTAMAYQAIGGIRMPITEGQTWCAIEFRFLDALLDHMCQRNKSLYACWHKVF